MNNSFLSDIQAKFIDSLQSKPVDFLMAVQDTFTMPGTATVVTGMIFAGTVRLKDIVEVITRDGSRFFLRVTGIEKDKRMIEVASKGDQVGILLQLHHSGMINVGDVLFRSEQII